jgi:hypothetical protein
MTRWYADPKASEAGVKAFGSFSILSKQYWSEQMLKNWFNAL